MQRLTNKLVKTLQERQLTIALGESMTCGLAAHQLSTVKGTMDILKGSVVCYQASVKTSLLKIPASLIQKYSAESHQVTEAFAENLPRLFDADIYAAVTGLASKPADGIVQKDKPVGTVYISVLFKKKVYTRKRVFRGTPLEIRRKACMEIYHSILEVIS